MLRYKQYLIEGGNVKVGNIAAQPIDTSNRQSTMHSIRTALLAIHKEHPFVGSSGKVENHLSGSSAHLFDSKISDLELHQHKPKMGDVDVMVNKSVLPKLQKHLEPGKRFGNYTVVGHHKHGNELSTLMKHDSGSVHQFDFEGGTTDRSGNPSIEEKFAHGSNWNDVKLGIKGVHKQRLLNAAGLDKYKWSITHGLKERTNTDKEPGIRNPHLVGEKLFGNSDQQNHMNSFTGITHMIKKHIDPKHHQKIYDKFKIPGNEHNDEHALTYLQNHLKVT